MGLEVNLLSFIPLIISSQFRMETERALKYFLVQAFGSGLLLFRVFFYIISRYFPIYSDFSLYIMIFRLIVKLGIVPFHFWLPHVMGGSS